MASQIYFTDMRCKAGDSLLDKLDRLIRQAGIEQIDFKQKYAAIKIHFGEPGNLSFLRPNFAKAVADRIKALGGLPFLTDSNTLYVGRRNNALVHLDAEYTKAVLYGRPNFHINVVNQVSPYCDCHNENDAAVIPDIGIFAGFDPVALDMACMDAVNAAPEISASILSEREHTHGDHFTNIHPTTNWRGQIIHAEKIGLGSSEYELVTVK